MESEKRINRKGLLEKCPSRQMRWRSDEGAVKRRNKEKQRMTMTMLTATAVANVREGNEKDDVIMMSMTFERKR